MWKSIDNNQQSMHNLSWLMEGMESNTLTWVTDGLYDRKRAADLCGVGWIIFCSKTGLRLTGTFWERSPLASSYQAEMLGLCALHLFARALSEFYKIQGWKLPCAATTKEHWSNPHTPVTGYGPVQSAQIYNKASRQQSTLLRVNLPTCTCMAIWTNISSGTNCHLFSN